MQCAPLKKYVRWKRPRKADGGAEINMAVDGDAAAAAEPDESMDVDTVVS